MANIFEKLSKKPISYEFSPSETPSNSKFDLEVEQEGQEANIFEQMATKEKQKNFGFLETAKDVGKQVVSKTISGLGGAYGNLLEAVGAQSPNRPDLLPGQAQRINSADQFDLGLDDDILPSYAKLSTSDSVQKLLKELTGVGEGETPAGRIAGRGAEFLGEGLAYPGSGTKALLALIGAGVGGQSIRESGLPEGLASGVEIAGSIIPSAIQGRLAPSRKEAKELTNAGRLLGLTEKEITPLAQSERKVATLSKIARKGDRTKELFSDVKNKLGESYQNIRKSVSNLGNVDNANKTLLETKFTNIRNDLSKTIKPSPDKESAIKFIDEAIDKIKVKGASPEELINFWQDINKSVKWNSLQGGKKSLAQLKEPILEVLQNVSPTAAKDFEMTNQLYSKYSQIAKKLKPDLVDSFANKAEIMSVVPAGMAFVHGNPWVMAGLAGEAALRTLATEMLTNPYFQNISGKLVQNFNSGSAKGVKDLVNNAKEYLQRKHPDQKWDFLISQDDEE